VGKATYISINAFLTILSFLEFRFTLTFKFNSKLTPPQNEYVDPLFITYIIPSKFYIEEVLSRAF